MWPYFRQRRCLVGLDFGDFVTCVGASGVGSTCQLDSGIYTISSSIEIGRGGITITGTTNDEGDVILQATSTLVSADAPIMYSDSGLAVTIEWLTFDGNRNGTTTCGTDYTATVADLDLRQAGVATVQYVDFISAAHSSLYLATSTSGQASTVSFSNFGQGFNEQGISRTAQQTASRAWAVIFYTGENTGAWYNNIAYAGSQAIDAYEGSYEYIIGNYINSNTYEQPQGIPGGQVWLPTSSYVSVADNVINGNYWVTSNAQQSDPTQPYYTLCAPGTSSDFAYTYPYGIEGSATGSQYLNNSIIQNLGFGMLLRPYYSTDIMDSVTISGYDPFCPSDCTYSPQYIQDNGGCYVYGSQAPCFTYPAWPYSMEIAGINVNSTAAGGPGSGSVTNLTLDHVRSIDNNGFGISLDHVSGTGFQDSAYSPASSYPYACITGNGTNVNSSTSGNSLTNSTYTNVCP